MVALADPLRPRDFLRARGNRVGTAGPEGAAGWDRGGARRVAPDEALPRHLTGLQPGRGREEGPGVGVPRAPEHPSGLGPLDDPAEVHDHDPGAHPLDHRQVVRDEDVGEAEAFAKVAHEPQDRRLHGHVEARGRLVEHDDARREAEDPGETDPPELPAGQLVRVARLEARVEPDRIEHPIDSLRALRARGDTVDLEPFREGAADAPPRVEGRARILVDVLDVTAGGACLAWSESAHQARVEPDLAFGLSLDAEDGAPEGRLSAARLADEPEELAGPELEAHPVDRPNRGFGPAEEGPAPAELRHDVLDAEDDGAISHRVPPLRPPRTGRSRRNGGNRAARGPAGGRGTTHGRTRTSDGNGSRAAG